MIVKNDESPYSNLLQSRCSHCGERITAYPFVQWDAYTNKPSGFATLVFHEHCAYVFQLSFARDVHELNQAHRRQINRLKRVGVQD
jgi:hypothetical protein